MRQVASVMGLFTSSGFFFAAAQRVERLKLAFPAVDLPLVAVFCSELEGRSLSRRLRSGSRRARKGSRDRNASGAGGLAAVAQLVLRSLDA